MANAAISQDISVLTNHVSMVSKTSESLPDKGARLSPWHEILKGLRECSA